MRADHWLALAIVAATLLGPIFAVLVTRTVDKRRQSRDRRLEVFRTLMRQRRNLLAHDYVAALNMVEIEFAGVEPVLRAYKALFDHYQTRAQGLAWEDQLRRLTARLLYSMGKNLGYSMEQLDILEGGYAPQAHGDLEAEQTALRHALLDVLRGARPLPVFFQAPPAVPPTAGAPVPPPEEDYGRVTARAATD